MKPISEAEAAALALSLGAELVVGGKTFNSERLTVARPRPVAQPVATQPEPPAAPAAESAPQEDKVAAALEMMGAMLRQTLTDMAAILAANPVIVAPATPGPTPSYEVKRSQNGTPVALIRTRPGMAPEEIPLNFGESRWGAA